MNLPHVDQGVLAAIKPLIAPQVNLNGSAREELVRQRLEIVTRIDALLGAMSAAMPHGRDYQTMDEGQAVTTRARGAFYERVAILEAFRREFFEEAECIIDEKGA